VLIAGLSIFKDGIHPSWEDERNREGSELQLEIRVEDYLKVDPLYQDIFLSIVGQYELSTNRVLIITSYRSMASGSWIS
jgi:Eukaryotic initiation factor 4E